MTAIVAVLAALLWLAVSARVALVAARMFQIEEYETSRFLHWAMSRAWLFHPSVFIAAAVNAVALVFALVAPERRDLVIAVGWLAAGIAAQALWQWTPAKKPLVTTARMRRILSVAAALALVPAAAVVLCIALGLSIVGALIVLVISGGVTLLMPLLLVVANTVLKPVEALIRRRYLRLARTRLAEVNPLVVAVAGSYGKTSTKHILAQLLQPSIATLPTRKSFNTLMGVTRAINEDLSAEHHVFIVEMDAYGPGEIASICRLVHPRIALLTSVGPQHLERFGRMERIADALYEVVTALPESGVALIHTGDAGGAALARRARSEGRRVVRYGSTANEVDVLADDVHLDRSGARFRWSWAAEGLQRQVAIPLLGLHQVLNVSAALAAVRVLGHDIDAAVATAASLQPVEHRLQLLAAGGPVTVIDDSYNANPVGVHNALDVLAAMDGGAKILVTPGLVELGSVEEEENRRYGQHAATVCDHVIVVAARPAQALCDGLRAAGMASDHIHLVHSLAEATQVISGLTRPGDVVLFANDLPDTYLPPRHLAAAAAG